MFQLIELFNPDPGTSIAWNEKCHDCISTKLFVFYRTLRNKRVIRPGLSALLRRVRELRGSLTSLEWSKSPPRRRRESSGKHSRHLRHLLSTQTSSLNLHPKLTQRMAHHHSSEKTAYWKQMREAMNHAFETPLCTLSSKLKFPN